MRKTIFTFATTALALWWVFGPIVASVRYSKSNESKLDAAAKRLNAAFVARGMRVVGEQIYDVAETLCTWDEKDWDIVAVYMVQLALGEITEEQYHQNLNAVAGITKKEA